MSERLARVVYGAASWAALPLFVIYGLWKGRRRGPSAADLMRRIGLGLEPLPQVHGGLWIHGVSYGETGVARRLARELKARGAGPVLLTASTGTGLELARQAASEEADAVWPSPVDLPPVVHGLLDATRPRALVLVEAEVWPATLGVARGRGLATALINGRITDRSYRGYRRLRWLFAPAFRGLDLVAVREPGDAERARSLGARPEAVLETGDIKFDVPAPEPPRLPFAAEGGPVWVAGSTLEGEEEAVLAAHGALVERFREAILILAPRHPQRFDSVARLVGRSGRPLARRSLAEPPRPGGVLLLDTMGELRHAYCEATLAFVGGSLLPAGGHNVIEPAAAGIPVLVGPHTPNFAAVVESLRQAGGLQVVADGEALAGSVLHLMEKPEEARSRGEQARDAVARCQGALQRTVDALLRVLPPRDRELAAANEAES